MTLQTTRRFDKSYAKLTAENKSRVDVALSLFMSQPFSPPLANHALKGKLKGLRSISAGYDLRIVYKEEGGHVIVLLLEVGTHDQVY